MTSYTVHAVTEADAIVTARNRAFDDGFRVTSVLRCFRGVMPGTWVVDVQVIRR